MIQSYLNTVDKFIVVGDKVLIKPRTIENRTESGLYLPPGVHQKEKIQSGYIVKTGPGYPVLPGDTDDQPWKKQEKARYIPLQSQEGDLAIFLQEQAHEIEFENEKYLIVPQSAILLLIRDSV